VKTQGKIRLDIENRYTQFHVLRHSGTGVVH
jgi:hypothetical protein